MRPPRFRGVAVAAAVLVLLLPGCINSEQKPAPITPAAVNATNQTTALPDGRQFEAQKETNRTVSNSTLDGQMHMHDYWKSKENVVVYDSDVDVGLVPVLERNDQSHVFEAFINLNKVPGTDSPALIFEGTGKVVFTITTSPAWATSYQMTFRTAAKDWTTWTPIEKGKSFEYVPDKLETDMPHSIRSLWNWKLQATAPAPVAGDLFGVGNATGQPLHVTVVVQKARNVDSWPPHPDFYGGTKERVVMLNKEGKTNVQNAADVEIYGVEPDQAVPEKLISMGTDTLDVFVNITQLTLPPGVPNGGFTLYWRTANTTPDSLGIFNIANETDKNTKAYWHLKLEPGTVDSPYQPTSRFGFKVLANPVNDSEVACYRCVPYTITYTMTIIARPDAAGTQTLAP